MLSVNPKVFGSVFAVPSLIVDKYIKMASPAAIKALLWILRNQSGDISVSALSKHIGFSVSDTQDAVDYWINEGVISGETEISASNESSVNTVKPENHKPIELKEEISAEKTAINLPEIKIAKPTLEQLNLRMAESEEVSTLMTEAQNILGRTFGFDVQSTLLMMYDTYGLKLEVIFTLLEFCVQNSTSSTAYIAKMAKIWAEREINTLEDANKFIIEKQNSDAMFTELKALTGISTPRPSTKQSDYLISWSKMGFDSQMISLAFDETSDRTGKISFNYMNKILENWHSQGFKTPEEVKKAAEEFKRRKAVDNKQKSENSFDINAAVKQAQTGTVKYKKREVR